MSRDTGSQGATQRDKLDRKIAELEQQAITLEERAIYAEEEAKLRARIVDAQKRIRATRSPGTLDSFLPGMVTIWKAIPSPLRVIGILLTVVIGLLLIGNAMSGG